VDEKADKPAYVMGRFAKHTLRREIVAGKGIELRLRRALHKNPIRKKFPSSAEEGRVEAKPRLGWCWSRKSICCPTEPGASRHPPQLRRGVACCHPLYRRLPSSARSVCQFSCRCSATARTTILSEVSPKLTRRSRRTAPRSGLIVVGALLTQTGPGFTCWVLSS